MHENYFIFPKDGGLASVGIVLAESVPETVVARFERILSCYCDLRKYSPRDDGSGKPPRPPPPYQLNEKCESFATKASQCFLVGCIDFEYSVSTIVLIKKCNNKSTFEMR